MRETGACPAPPATADGRHQVTYGLSDPADRPELAPQALRQAQHAIDLGIRIGRTGQAISYSELGIYRLLLQIGDMHQLWRFAEDVLGALIEYDARHKVDLVRTLSIYLNQRESLKQTARVLRVHVNTVSYRIQRIERLTSLDFANPDHGLSAHVAAKIIESRKVGGQCRCNRCATSCPQGGATAHFQAERAGTLLVQHGPWVSRYLFAMGCRAGGQARAPVRQQHGGGVAGHGDRDDGAGRARPFMPRESLSLASPTGRPVPASART